jgi:UDPglucose 6-dehydrogenase
LAYKPETDDMRDAPSLVMINALIEAGAMIQAYDPKAMTEAHKHFAHTQHIRFCDDKDEALEGCQALIILTEWRAFKSPDFSLLKDKLLEPTIFDGRNIYCPATMEQLGFAYYGIGRGRA